MKLKSTKAIITAVGGFLTLVLANFTDDALPVDNFGNVISGLIGLGLTVYSTWRVENKPKSLKV
jgi:hypothetical protein